MFTRIQALNFKSLRYVNQDLEPFQVLVGPNASGKTTFLGVLGFLGDLVNRRDLRTALLYHRAPSVQDLTWMRKGEWFELAVEAKIPEKILDVYKNAKPNYLRYEVRIGLDPESKELAILNETLWTFTQAPVYPQVQQKTLFPHPPSPPDTILWSRKTPPKGAKKVINRLPETGNTYFGSETGDTKLTFKLGKVTIGLANLPADEAKFPAGVWLKNLLTEGVQRIVLNSDYLRRPAPPGAPKRFLPDGSNLPWIIEELAKDPARFHDWVAHIQTALPDVKSIRTFEREEDKNRYVILEYTSGLEAPSWLISDGTLRLMALTLIAYLGKIEGVFLVEEPENGIHPRAVETVLDALASAYSAQVFVATHSPVILSIAEPKQVLCFARTAAGAVDIVRGNMHPKLVEWKGETDLGTLFASGVLG